MSTSPLIRRSNRSASRLDIPPGLENDDAGDQTYSLCGWLWLIVMLSVLTWVLSVPAVRHMTLLNMDIWRLAVVFLVLTCGGLVSKGGVTLLVFLMEKQFRLQVRLLYFVYGVRSSVCNFIWAGLVMVTWTILIVWHYQQQQIPGLERVTQIGYCFVMTTGVWLVKMIAVKVIGAMFHVRVYFERIQNSLLVQHLIVTLSGKPIRDGRPQVQRAVGENLGVDRLMSSNENNVSAWDMDRWIHVVRNELFSTLNEGNWVHIKTDQEAQAVAEKIFLNIVKQQPGYSTNTNIDDCRIAEEDLRQFLTPQETKRAMPLIYKEGNTISKTSLNTWVVDSLKDRKSLAWSLNDTKTAVQNLNGMLNVVAVPIVAIFSLIILEVAQTHLFTLLGSQLLILGFVFQDACKATFEDIIFIFVTHPFDVGDLCEIDGVQLTVEEMSIRSTVFLRDDKKMIIYPNHILATLPITNYNRSPQPPVDVDLV